jgi:hypothetical protein
VWDNSPEFDDPGIAPEVALDIATMLAGTTFNLRTVIETYFGWECTQDLCIAVEKIVNRCQCGLWMPAHLDRALCLRCAKRRAELVESIEWNPTSDDLAFLAAIGAAKT